jgi:hypothetical protein
MASPTKPVQRNGKRRWIVAVSLGAAILVIGGTLFAISHEPLRSAIAQKSAQSCGTILFVRDNPSMLSTDTASARATELCFVQALASCHAATLIAMFLGLDTLYSDTFVIELPFALSRSCQLAVTWHDDIDGTAIQRSGTDMCAGIAQTGGMVQFESCGSRGTVNIPFPAN